MRIIEIKATKYGAHDNQDFHGLLPEGWAIIPDELETKNFPYGEVEAEEIEGLMTVVKWTPGEPPEIPEPEPVPEEDITQLDRIEAQVTYTAMMTDTLLEV